MSFANVHMHSFFSDGVCSPEDLVARVHAIDGLAYFALTDHDTLSGIEPAYRALAGSKTPQDAPAFIPGVELSLEEKSRGLYIHMLGYFPRMTLDNYREELRGIDAVIGDYCRLQCAIRGGLDIDGRMEIVWRDNIDGVRERYSTMDELIRILYRYEDERITRLTAETGKSADVIRHPIPKTYQVMIDKWPELVPESSTEKMMLYIVRPDSKKIARLAELFREDGLSDSEAAELAEKRQGVLYLRRYAGAQYADIFDGLKMLKAAGAVAVLAHPGVERPYFSFDEYDALVTHPLIDAGLDGVEVYYPYNSAFRDDAIRHYNALTTDRGILATGGTDYHGDGRSGFADVTPGVELADALIAAGR